MAEESLKPDTEIEMNMVEQVLRESLDEGQREYLLEVLEQDELLANIFDTLLISATEFSGEGAVEGPGTETSDEVPARLSDGEFVISSKAVQQIGAENLMRMMKEAEAMADTPMEQSVPVQNKPVDPSLLQRPTNVNNQPQATRDLKYNF